MGINMNLKFSEEVKSQFGKITGKFTGKQIHCRFMTFGSSGPTWKKRVEMRNLLVKTLKGSLKNFPEDYGKKLLTPGIPPRIPGISISISHCPVFGGFVFSPGKDISLGLDIEKADRVSFRSVKYVSGFREIEETPEPSFLWVAKEAAFKSVPLKWGIFFLKDFFIFNWKRVKTDAHSFTFLLKKKRIQGEGVVFTNNHLIFGCTLLRDHLV